MIELSTAAGVMAACGSSLVALSVVVIERQAFVEIFLWPVAYASGHAVTSVEASDGLSSSTIVTKPMTVSELVSAIDQQPVECIVPVMPGVFLNTRKLQLIRLGAQADSIKLTAAECQLIKCLAEARSNVQLAARSVVQSANCFVSEQELLKTVCGYSHQAASHTVKTHVARLRQKLGSGFVVREGDGYRLDG